MKYFVRACINPPADRTARSARVERGYAMRHTAHASPSRLLFAALLCAAVLAVTPAPGAALRLDWPTEPVDIGRELRNAWTFHPCDDARLAHGGAASCAGETVPSFPHDWRKGDGPRSEARIAWYRLEFDMGARSPRAGDLMLRLGPVNDADETFLNGVPIGATGVIDSEGSSPREHGWDRVRLYRVPAALVRADGPNALAVRVQRYFPDEAGFRTAESTVLFGDEAEVRAAFNREQIVPLAVFAALASAGLYFMLAWVRLRGAPAGLFLGLCCVAAALYFIMKTQAKYFLADDFMLLKRIEYAAGAFAPYLFMDYLYFLFARRRGNMGRVEKAAMLFINAAAVASIVPFFASDTILLWDRWMYTAAEPLLVAPVAMSYRVLAAGTAADRRSATIIIAGYTICVAAVAHDVLVHRALIDNAPVGQWPFLVFVIALQQMMGRLEPGTGKKRERIAITDRSEERLEAVIAYLGEHYNRPLSRENLAARHGMSADHLSRTFHAYTGMKITDYVNRLRVDYARGELVATDRPVIDIALDAGFESLRTFNRVFARVEGTSPTAYRARKRAR